MTIDALRERVDYWIERLHALGLAHFTYTVKWSETPHDQEDTAAAVIYDDDYDAFYLEASRSWFHSHTEKQQDEVIIHELLHVAFRDYDNCSERVGNYMGFEVRSLWNGVREHELERLIRRLSTTLVNL